METQQDMLIEKQLFAEKRFATRIDGLSYEVYQLTQKVENLFSQQQRYLVIEKNLRDEIIHLKSVNESLLTTVLEMVKRDERHICFESTFLLFKNSKNLYASIHKSEPAFLDGLIMMANWFTEKSILTFSKTLPYDDYVEYEVAGYGDTICCFLSGCFGSSVFVEVVSSGRIVYQVAHLFDREGVQKFSLPEEIRGKAYLRFKINDNRSIIRVLLINRRKRIFFVNSNIAAYIY